MRQVIDVTAGAALLITLATSARRFFLRASSSTYAGAKNLIERRPALRGVEVLNVLSFPPATDATPRDIKPVVISAHDNGEV
jgi:hypothetical protein